MVQDWAFITLNYTVEDTSQDRTQNDLSSSLCFSVHFITACCHGMYSCAQYNPIDQKP